MLCNLHRKAVSIEFSCARRINNFNVSFLAVFARTQIAEINARKTLYRREKKEAKQHYLIMPPSKTQAQKRAEQEAKVAEKAAERAAKAAELKAKFQTPLNSQRGTDSDEGSDKDNDRRKKRNRNHNRRADDDEESSSSSQDGEEEENEEGEDEDASHIQNKDATPESRSSLPRDLRRKNKQLRHLHRAKQEQQDISEMALKQVADIAAQVVSAGSNEPAARGSAPSGSGRLVMNHSTHCDGLIPVLRRLTHKLDSRFTITPGIIAQNQSGRAGLLVIDMRRSDEDTCLNLLAKKGSTVQEIVIQMPASFGKDKLFSLVQDAVAHVEKVYAEENDNSGASSAASAARSIPLTMMSNRDFLVAASQQEIAQRKAQHQQAHHEAQQKEKERKEAAAEQERAKRLQGKVGREAADEYAERDEAIVNGGMRGRHAM